MNSDEIIKKQQEHFKKISTNFSKTDVNYITSKSNFREKILELFTVRRTQRKKLMLLGTISYGLVFRKYEIDDKYPMSTWVLFSPMSKINENPAILQQTYDKVCEIINNKKCGKKYRKLKVMMTENYTEPRYFMVPPEICGDNLIYLSHVYLWKAKIPSFKLGLNLFFIDKSVSKDIMYVPEKYWVEEYKKFYL